MKYAILCTTHGVQVMRLDSVHGSVEVYARVRMFRWDADSFDAFDRACDHVRKLQQAEQREDWQALARLEESSTKERE